MNRLFEIFQRKELLTLLALTALIIAVVIGSGIKFAIKEWRRKRRLKKQNGQYKCKH